MARFFRAVRLQAHIQIEEPSWTQTQETQTSPFKESSKDHKIPSQYCPPRKYKVVETYIKQVQKDLNELEAQRNKGSEENLLDFHQIISSSVPSISLSLSYSRRSPFWM